MFTKVIYLLYNGTHYDVFIKKENVKFAWTGTLLTLISPADALYTVADAFSLSLRIN